MITSRLLGTAILLLTTTAQSADRPLSGFQSNTPSSQTLSRELEPPYSNNFVSNPRPLPQPNSNPQPEPITSFRQTIFTPNIRHDDSSRTAILQNFPSTNPRGTLPLGSPQRSSYTFQTSFVNSQTSNQFVNPPAQTKGQSNQFPNPSTLPQGQFNSVPSPILRIPGNVNFGTPFSQTAPRTSQPAFSFNPRPSVTVVNSPSPSTTPLQRDGVLQRQPARDTGVLQQTNLPTQPVSVSSVRFSSSNGRAFSYSSGSSDSRSANPSGPAVELLPPVSEESTARNFPSVFSPTPKPSVPVRQNRFADVTSQGFSGFQQISQSGESPNQTPKVEVPLRNSLATGRSIENFTPFGQNNQILQSQQQIPSSNSNPAGNTLQINAEIHTDRPGIPVELLPPTTQDSQANQHTGLQPNPLLIKNQQLVNPGEINSIVNLGEKAAQTITTNPSVEDVSTNLPSSPPTSLPTALNELPSTKPQSAFESLNVSDFKVETIHPIIQDIITSVDRNPNEKESSSKTIPSIPQSSSILAVDLQPPFSSNVDLPSPVAFDFNQPKDTPSQTSGGSPPTSGTPPSTSNNLKENSPDKILSTVLTFNTPLPSPSPDQPSTTDFHSLPNLLPPTTTLSSPKATQTIPTNSPLFLDLQPPEDKLQTHRNEHTLLLPPPQSEGFVIFQNPLSTTPTKQFPPPITNQYSPGVIRLPEPFKTPISTDLLPPFDQLIPSLTTPEEFPTSQTVRSAPQVEQGSITTSTTPSTDSEVTPNPSPSPTTSTTSTKPDPEERKLPDLVPPLLDNITTTPTNVSSVEKGSDDPPFNLTTKVITNVTFSATHGPGTPCVQLDLQHKGYRAPQSQFGGDLLLAPGYYPTDNPINETRRQCGKTDAFDGRRFNWWQILIKHGGEPSAVSGSLNPEDPTIPPLKKPCLRPLETEGVPIYYNYTNSDLESFYREEVAYHRFPETTHTFLESRGLIVWRSTTKSNDTTATATESTYLLRYTRDDTGFWLEVKTVDCHFQKDPPSLRCHSIPECTCADGAEKTCSDPVLVFSTIINKSNDAKA